MYIFVFVEIGSFFLNLILEVFFGNKQKMSISSTDLKLHRARMLYIKGDVDNAINMYNLSITLTG